MKKIILFFLCMFLMAFSVNAEKIDVTLNACVDGDTAWFNLNGEKTKFRFLGIDTPESVHPKKQVELYGKDASEYTCNLLTNANKIQIEYQNELGAPSLAEGAPKLILFVLYSGVSGESAVYRENDAGDEACLFRIQKEVQSTVEFF